MPQIKHLLLTESTTVNLVIFAVLNFCGFSEKNAFCRDEFYFRGFFKDTIAQVLFCV